MFRILCLVLSKSETSCFSELRVRFIWLFSFSYHQRCGIFVGDYDAML